MSSGTYKYIWNTEKDIYTHMYDKSRCVPFVIYELIRGVAIVLTVHYSLVFFFFVIMSSSRPNKTYVINT
jgi:hypothetical protein